MIALLQALVAAGYRLQLVGDKLVLDYGGDTPLDPAQVTPLIDALKARKSQAVAILRYQATIQVADTDAALEAVLTDVDAAFEQGQIDQVDAEALAKALVQRGRELTAGEAGEGLRLSTLLADTPICRVHSRVLGEDLLIAADDAELPVDNTLVVYRETEVRQMIDLGPAPVRAIHAAKQALEGEVIVLDVDEERIEVTDLLTIPLYGPRSRAGDAAKTTGGTKPVNGPAPPAIPALKTVWAGAVLRRSPHACSGKMIFAYFWWLTHRQNLKEYIMTLNCTKEQTDQDPSDNLFGRPEERFNDIGQYIGPGTEKASGFPSTHHELLQLVKYWTRRELEFSWFNFLYGQALSREQSRARSYCCWRIELIADRIGSEPVERMVKEAESEFAQTVDPRHWDIFQNGEAADWGAVQGELHRKVEESFKRRETPDTTASGP